MKCQNKDLYMGYKDKKQFIKHLPELIQNHSKTHAIYFITITFKTPKTKASYTSAACERYIKLLRLKLDKALLSNSKKFENRPILILFPEISKANTPEHLHGFILIHNSTLAKFNKFCIKETTKEPIAKLDNDLRDNIVLKDYLLDANTLIVPKSLETQNRYDKEHTLLQSFRDIPVRNRTPEIKDIIYKADDCLNVDNHKMYLISNITEFFGTSFYSTKNFISNERDYILETKDKPKDYKPKPIINIK